MNTSFYSINHSDDDLCLTPKKSAYDSDYDTNDTTS